MEKSFGTDEDIELEAKFTNFQDQLNKADAAITGLNGQVESLTNQNQELLQQMETVQQSLSEYVSLSDQIIDNQEIIISLYKDLVRTREMLGGLMSISEHDTITAEIKRARSVFNLGLRGGEAKDLATVFQPRLFSNSLEQLKQQCSTVISVLEQLVLSSKNAGRNTIKTPSLKMKAAVHLLSSLMDVRDQNASNDITILFGLLCMCFGAGQSMINLLQRLGLSESPVSSYVSNFYSCFPGILPDALV